jgi:Na+-translocating ferredoxin:NAD+ oxidoreductase RnfC subunit
MHKRLEDERKSRTAPLRDQIVTVDCEYTEPRDLLTKIEKKLKDELLVFRNAESKHIEEQRRIEMQTAERERARLEEKARQDREAAAKRAAKLREQGRDEQAASVLRKAESEAQAKERTAALVSAPMQPTEPTKVAGVSVRKVWKAKVTNLRKFLSSLAGSPYQIEEFVTINQRPLDRLATSLQENMDQVLPGSIAWEDEGIAARSK